MPGVDPLDRKIRDERVEPFAEDGKKRTIMQTQHDEGGNAELASGVGRRW
jgi:hypothetical protein